MKYMIAVQVDGESQFAIGTWTDTDDAVAWMDRFDEFFGDLERDLAKENQRIVDGYNAVEVETVVIPVVDGIIVNRKELWEAQVAE